jgi:UPF0271 protein
VKLLVLDASAIMGGFAPGLSKAELVTTEEVLEETHDLRSKLKLETAVTLGKVKVLEPSGVSVRRVREKVAETGDRVSVTDIKLLALSLDLRGKGAVLLTDDYAIQNLASLLNIPYQKVSMPGIKEVLRWVSVCPACEKTYAPSVSECPACGSSLTRKSKKTELLKDGSIYSR